MGGLNRRRKCARSSRTASPSSNVWQALQDTVSRKLVPWLNHAMETVEELLVALYLWRDGDLTQKSLIC